VTIKDGKFIAVGIDEGIMANRGSATQLIDLKRRTAIPGLNDSHIHLIRGGLNFNLELRWEVVRLAYAQGSGPV
jgi:predicted amidohydrolase YtcJ